MVGAHGKFAVKGDKSRYTVTVRLAAEEQRAFLVTHPDATVVQYGAVMRGYVRVPEAIARKPAALAELFARSVAFARTLPAKPTTRGKAAAKKAWKK